MKPAIYMDNAATTWPKPQSVYEAMDNFMRHIGANPSRSAHRLAVEAGRAIYEAREAVARLFNIDDPLRIVFTKNCTEGLNLAMGGLLCAGDHVITSGMEHNAVMRPLRALVKKGIELSVIPCSADGVLNPEDVEKAIKPSTRLIVLNHASNVVGTFLPVMEVGTIARRYSVLFCVDSAQVGGAFPIDIKAANVDLLAFSGHKSLLGPMGTGGLYIAKGLDGAIEPLTRGGTGSRSESEHQPDFMPDKYESGTPNTVGLAGLSAGVKFVLFEGVSAIRAREEHLTKVLLEGLSSIPRVTVYGSLDAAKQVAVVSFNIEGLPVSKVAAALDEDHGVMCRSGLHCAPIAHRTVGTFPGGTVRLSPGYFTTEDEIKAVLLAVSRVAGA